MRSLSQHILLICAFVLFTAIGLSPAQAANNSHSDRMKQSTAELNNVRQRIKALEQKLEKDRKKKSRIARQLQQIEQRISELITNLNKLQDQANQQQKQVDRTRSRQHEQNNALSDEREALSRQVRAAYYMGRQEKTKLILNQEDPTKVGRMLAYYDYLNQARIRQIRAIQQKIADLTVVQKELDAELQALNKVQQERQTALKRLESTRESRNQAIDRLESEISRQGQKLGKLKQDEVALEKLIVSLQAVLADIPLDLGSGTRFPRLKGRLPWPQEGRLLAAFNQEKGAGDLRWRGIWISADNGSPVRAVARGRVAYVGWMHRYGLIIVIEHGDKYFTLYGHNESVTASLGQWVDQGDIIATAGNTGGHRQNGVYFEIRRAKDPVNPLQWLARR